MPLPFRRADPRRVELEQLRQQIAQMRNELSVLDASAQDDASHDQPPSAPAAGATDIYTSVSRLRLTMVRRELRTKQQELDALIRREADLAQALRVRPMQEEAPPPPVASTNGRPANGSVAAAPPAAPAQRTPTPSSIQGPIQPKPTQPKPVQQTGDLAVKRARVEKRQERAPRPQSERRPHATPINAVNIVLSIVAIVIIVAIGLVLSGLLDVNPSRDYGVLSSIARVLQSVFGPLSPSLF